MARLRQLRQITDEHAGKFRSDGLRALFATVEHELDDDYFEEVGDHLKQLRFRAGVLISARLDRDNSGIDFVLRAPAATRRGGPSCSASGRARPTPSPSRPATRPAARSCPTSPAAASTSSPTPPPSPPTTSAATSPCSRQSWASTSAASTSPTGWQPKGPPVTRPRPGQAVVAHVLVHRLARRLPGAAVAETRCRQRRSGRRETADHHHRRQLRREIDVPAQRRRGPAHDAVRHVRYRRGPTRRTSSSASSPTSSGKRTPA